MSITSEVEGAHMKTKLVLAAIATLLLAGCGASGDVVASTGTPAAVPATTAPTPDAQTSDPVVSDTPDPTTTEFTTSAFGTTGTFVNASDSVFTVMVGKPVKAKCQYQTIGCDKPATGDRVVTLPVTVKNTSTAAIEISGSQFVLEFADGTRMGVYDGSTADYRPDNAMDYSGHKVRPGATYKSTLTFEAPKGAFTVILLSNTFNGDDLHGWK